MKKILVASAMKLAHALDDCSSYAANKNNRIVKSILACMDEGFLIGI
jgi:hypothetical protein